LEDASRCVLDDVLAVWVEEKEDVEERFGSVRQKEKCVNGLRFKRTAS
jgi:hypothetical protein